MSSSILTNIDLSFTASGALVAAGNLTFENVTGTTYIWPTVDATANQVLGAGAVVGTMEWVDPSAPAGVAGSFQFNSDPAGSFDNVTNFVWDSTNNRVLFASPTSTTTAGSFPAGSLVLDLRNNDTAGDSTFFNVSSASDGIGGISFNNPTNGDNLLISHNFSTNVGAIQTSTGQITVTSATDISLNATVDLNLISAGFNINNNGNAVNWPTTAPAVGEFLIVDPTNVANLTWSDMTVGSTGILTVVGANNIVLSPVDGSVTAIEFNATSDERMKKNIKDICTDCLDKVLAIEPKMFNYRDEEEGSSITFGVIAQQLENVGLGNIVRDGDYKSVNFNQLVALLIGAVKELNNKIDKQVTNDKHVFQKHS